MKTLSVIIPARNELFLQRTVEGLLANLSTDFEILVGLDGYVPAVSLKPDPRVRLIYSEKVRGLRGTVNALAREATGQWIMRIDAHCLIAKGMDRELVQVCEPDMIVVPRQYQLSSATWERRERTVCDYRYLSPLDDPEGALKGLAWSERMRDRADFDVDETMTISGNLHVMERDLFVRLGGMDERYGNFFHEGTELSCKTWLSGGRVMVNKRTWYAHWNRGGKGRGSPYVLGRHQRSIAESYSVQQWLGNGWPGATRKFDWLIEHFSPVPGWGKSE